MATKNSTILGRFYLNGTNDMQQRIPNPTQSSVAKVCRHLFDPMNGDLYNQFADFMVQRIGYAYARQQRWENPLKEFFKQKLYYGSTVTETQLNWIKAHSYNVDAEQQFKTYFPEGMQAFHSIDDQRQYPISLSREQLRQAVAEEYGLNSIAAAIMQQPMNADEYDTYDMMLDLFKRADDNYGLYRQKMDAAPTDQASATALLKMIQELSFDLTVPTTEYACVDLPVVIKEEEMVLFVRSDTMASLNVDALAVLFNMEKAEIPYRIKVVPKKKWPLNDSDYAILTSSDFFQCYPVEYSTTSQWDPQGLKTNYWLNDWNVISFSPFVPIIVFSTDEGTAVPVVTMNPTSLQIAGDANAKPGAKVPLTLTLNGTVEPNAYHGPVEVAPDAALFSVAATRDVSSAGDGSELAPVALNTRTRVDQYGVLHIQSTDLKPGDKITVTAVSTYLNPNGATTPITATHDVAID